MSAKLKGGILKDGRLYIQRAGLPKPADCRFCTSVTDVKVQGEMVAIDKDKAATIYRQGFSCSDHCAHFGEPRVTEDGTYLMLCNGTILTFEEFNDQRITPVLMEKKK